MIRPSYSPKYGKGYVVGYCHEYDSELTFRIDRITDADIDWVDVFPPEFRVKQNGLYLVACRNDMHLEFELRKYNNGGDIIAFYQYENGLDSSHYQDDILAYHYIPYFEEVDNKIWFPFDKEYKEIKKGLYTFAYTLEGQEVEDNWDDFDWGTRMSTQFFSTLSRLNKTTVNGICYAVDFIHVPFDKLRMGKNINILSYNYCSNYTESDHCHHWDLARKMGLIKNSNKL